MKKLNCYKNLVSVKAISGWGKMYYCFRDLDRFDSAYFLNYLIDSEPTPEGKCFDEGYEDYLWYGDTYIRNQLGAVSNYVINQMVDDLVKHKYIFTYQRTRNSPRYIKLNYEKIAKAMGIEDLTDVSTDVSKNLRQNRLTDNQTLQSNNYIYSSEEDISENSTSLENENNEIYTSAPAPAPADYKAEIKEIIDYLNSKTNSNYRYTSESNNKFIKARLNEGFTVEDFKLVIDKRCREWINTEYSQYLRPQTLFGNKFESYLNAPERKNTGNNRSQLAINNYNPVEAKPELATKGF